MNGLLNRIREIAQCEGISIGALERSIGASKGVLSRAFQNNTDIQSKWLIRIVENYPRYSALWLLSGEGSMFKENIQKYEERSTPDVRYQKIPVYELEATAGFSSIYTDIPSDVSDYISIPNLPPVDGAIYARGDSMSPLISSGDIVVFKKMELASDSILWGHIYIVSYNFFGDDYTVLKYIRKSTHECYIRLESFNSRYDPLEIPKTSITALALVKASITFHTIG